MWFNICYGGDEVNQGCSTYGNCRVIWYLHVIRYSILSSIPVKTTNNRVNIVALEPTFRIAGSFVFVSATVVLSSCVDRNDPVRRLTVTPIVHIFKKKRRK